MFLSSIFSYVPVGNNNNSDRNIWKNKRLQEHMNKIMIMATGTYENIIIMATETYKKRWWQKNMTEAYGKI
jgi:hypothetical protein